MSWLPAGVYTNYEGYVKGKQKTRDFAAMGSSYFGPTFQILQANRAHQCSHSRPSERFMLISSNEVPSRRTTV